MKCPKCSYTSFDYNETCPKCKKGLTEVRSKLNLPSFRPLASSFADTKNRVPEKSGSIKIEQKKDVDPEKTTELQFSKTQDIDFQLEPASVENTEESGIDFSLEDASDDLSVDLDETAIGDSAAETLQTDQENLVDNLVEADLDFSFDDPSGDLSLDSVDFELGDTATLEPQAQQTPVEDTDEEDLDFFSEDTPDYLSQDLDETAIGDSAAETLQTDEETLVENTVKADLDQAFEEETGEPLQQSDQLEIEATDTAGLREEKQETEKDVFDIDLHPNKADSEGINLSDTSEEDEATASFEPDDLTIEETKIVANPEVAAEDKQISHELEESISILEKPAHTADSLPVNEEKMEGNNPSQLEVLDLDLDLEKLDDN